MEKLFSEWTWKLGSTSFSTLFCRQVHSGWKSSSPRGPGNLDQPRSRPFLLAGTFRIEKNLRDDIVSRPGLVDYIFNCKVKSKPRKPNDPYTIHHKNTNRK